MIIKWFYHLIKFQKLSAESFGLLTHALGFWEGSYKKKSFGALQGDLILGEKFWEKKLSQKNRVSTASLLQEQKKEFSFSKHFHPYQTTKSKFLFFYFSFKHSIEANKIQGSQFSSKEHKSKRWKPSEGKINTASTSLFYSFLYYF